jgi:hypothetical protein
LRTATFLDCDGEPVFRFTSDGPDPREISDDLGAKTEARHLGGPHPKDNE